MEKRLENNHIYVNDNAFSHLSRLLRSEKFSKLFLLTDENVRQQVLPIFWDKLSEQPSCKILEVEAGEKSKSPETLTRLWSQLAKAGADRYSLLINLGGGMITDLGGMVASTYMRGMAFANFPTSLLAMADASVGGKTGINLEGIKNRVGTFAQPRMVGVETAFLETLPEDEYRSGLAEMLKHGLIRDSEHFYRLLAQNSGQNRVNPDEIATTIALKLAVVEQDPQEKGLRKILNFGHTIGHALETYSHQINQPLKHGMAIALGMQTELWLSHKYCGFFEKEVKEINGQLQNIYGTFPENWETAPLLNLIRSDKKNRDGGLHFSLLREVGNCTYDVPVQEKDIPWAIQKSAGRE